MSLKHLSLINDFHEYKRSWTPFTVMDNKSYEGSILLNYQRIGQNSELFGFFWKPKRIREFEAFVANSVAFDSELII